MKLKAKSVPAPLKGAITIDADNFDAGVMYLGSHIPTASIRKEAVGLEVPAKLDKNYYLIVTGDKPGTAVHPIAYDGKDRYRRHARSGKTVYGSVKAINEACEGRLVAKVVDLAGLKALAKKMSLAVTAIRKSDDKQFKVLLLAPPEQSAFAGVYVSKGQLHTLNMEKPHGSNAKALQFIGVQEADPKPLIKEVLAAA